MVFMFSGAEDKVKIFFLGPSSILSGVQLPRKPYVFESFVMLETHFQALQKLEVKTSAESS
jgi:hypothetical protein